MPYTISDFKISVLERQNEHSVVELSNPEVTEECTNADCDERSTSQAPPYEKDPGQSVVEHIASLFLKLESVYNVSSRCMDQLVEELHFVSQTASISVIRNTVESHLRKNNCTL